MVKRRIAEFGGQDGYSASLMQRITSGDLKQYTDSWISGHAYNDLRGNGNSLRTVANYLRTKPLLMLKNQGVIKRVPLSYCRNARTRNILNP